MDAFSQKKFDMVQAKIGNTPERPTKLKIKKRRFEMSKYLAVVVVYRHSYGAFTEWQEWHIKFVPKKTLRSIKHGYVILDPKIPPKIKELRRIKSLTI